VEKKGLARQRMKYLGERGEHPCALAGSEQDDAEFLHLRHNFH
jgi:hypothetical protein